MEELQDYSGPINLNLNMMDFSKEAIFKLLQIGARGLVAIDGVWFGFVREKCGWDVAHDLEVEMWAGKRTFETQNLDRVCKAMNIKGNDVETVFKYLQVTPTLGIYMWNFTLELQDKNHGTLTMTRCPGIEYWEKHNLPEMSQMVCVEIDEAGWMEKSVAHYFNPKIKVRPGMPIPRKEKGKYPCCQWIFSLDE